MEWFRHYHGLCIDPKLQRVAIASKVSRGLVIAAWCAVLETASEHEDRGYAGDIDVGTLAYMIDVKSHVANRILDGLKKAGLLDEEGYVSAWSKRQKMSDDVKTRVQRHRERKSKPLNTNGTGGTGNVTETRQIQTQNQKEETESKPPPSESPTQAVDDDGEEAQSGHIVQAIEEPDVVSDETMAELIERCPLLSPQRVRREVAIWVKSAGSAAETERIILAALRTARDPIGYASRVIGKKSADVVEAVERGRAVAERPPPAPWKSDSELGGELFLQTLAEMEARGHG